MGWFFGGLGWHWGEGGYGVVGVVEVEEGYGGLGDFLGGGRAGFGFGVGFVFGFEGGGAAEGAVALVGVVRILVCWPGHGWGN